MLNLSFADVLNLKKFKIVTWDRFRKKWPSNQINICFDDLAKQQIFENIEENYSGTRIFAFYYIVFCAIIDRSNFLGMFIMLSANALDT